MASIFTQSADPASRENPSISLSREVSHALLPASLAKVNRAAQPSLKLSSAKKSGLLKASVKNAGLISVGAAAGGCLFQFMGFGGGGLGNGGGGFGGWGWKGFGGSPWHQWTQTFIAIASLGETDEQFDFHGMKVGVKTPLSKVPSERRYKLSGVELIDSRISKVVGASDPFQELVTLKQGMIVTKAQLQTEMENLSGCGMFEKVEMDVTPQKDGTITLQISFVESQWQAAECMKCINVGLLPQSRPPDVDLAKMSEKERDAFVSAQEDEYRRRIRRARSCMLPESVEEEISNWLSTERNLSARMLQKIRDRVQKWYHDNGFVCAQVVNFGNLNTKEIVCEVVEGDITKVLVQFQDKMGLPCEGNTRMEVVERELPRQLQPGYLFNIEAGKQALRNVNGLALFSNIEVNPRPDEEQDGGIVVEVKLKELDQKTAEVSTEWSLAPGSSGWPTLASIQPGGSVTFEHRNLQGLNRSLFGSVTSNNLLNSQDDLGFKMEYVHPYLDGVTDTRNRTFKVSCFNSRKLSPVFAGGPGLDDVPAIWVDRAGLKANITENFTRQSKFTYGLVFEEITTRDETSAICANGARTLASGALMMDGPPTTLSGTGIDRMAFLQMNITRDNTVFVNGTPIGDRSIFQVDQGLGIGSKNPFFNRHMLTLTRFSQLKKIEEGVDKPPPPVLVLHGRYGGCIGDLPPYDAFVLGGPYSVRGYNMGELGACRNILEAAVELRVPIQKTHVHGFIEYGTDLGSSKDVNGNPTEFFRRAGSGMSYGVGIKLGLIRAEYIKDCNSGLGNIFIRFGERF